MAGANLAGAASVRLGRWLRGRRLLEQAAPEDLARYQAGLHEQAHNAANYARLKAHLRQLERTAIETERAPNRAGAATNIGSDLVTTLGDRIARWLGPFEIKRYDARGFVALSKDGLRRFRIDFDGHGHPPHAHLEVWDARIGDFVDAIPGRHHLYVRE